MDVDIQFGDLEESQPQPQLRPDENKHYAVVPYGQVAEDDLPIFVDLDVMQDMEVHALSDTSVELGGVLLGGQFQDDQGRAFVVVTDSLRAEHYEATKGSFKFTHETWETISRQRDEFPDDLQMVGWYHTHPDWGVFLSGMDVFICDHFFNKTLDVALVIDPCRGDRGWFQWTGDSAERIRRTQSFYLMTSRFRKQELEFFVEQLKGNGIMASDPRFRGIAGQIGPQAAPVVNIAEQRNPGLNIAVMGMLTIQFLFLALVAWQWLGPARDEKEQNASQAEQLDRLSAQLDQIQNSGQQAVRQEAQSEILQMLITSIDSGQRNFVQHYEQEKAKSRRLQNSLDGMIDSRELMLTNHGKLKQEFDVANNTINRLRETITSKDELIAAKREELATNKKELDKLKSEEGYHWWKDWKVLSIGAAAAIVFIGVGVVLGYTIRREEDEDPEPTPQISVPEQESPPDSE